MTSGLQRADAPPVVLASASRTRADLLEAAGIEAKSQAAAVDEAEIKVSFRAAGGSAAEAAVALAELKAERVSRMAPPTAIVLGADQILTAERVWFDKPTDQDVARKQLEQLSGQPHQLHTAVVAFRNGVRVWHHLDLTRLWMRDLSPAFLDRYLQAIGDDVMQTVGGYHMERFGPHLFSRIEGDHFSILGLPLLPVLDFLRAQGVLLR